MLLFGPIGTSSSSSQFRLKYPNTRLNDPSGFSSHPSYAGTTFWPVRTTWALVGENPARTTATTASTPHASARGRESLMPALTMFDLPQLLNQPNDRLEISRCRLQIRLRTQSTTNRHSAACHQNPLLLPAPDRRDRDLAVATQRTAQYCLSAGQMESLPSLGHLLLELFVGQGHGLPDVDQHVVNRAVGKSGAVWG